MGLPKKIFLVLGILAIGGLVIFLTQQPELVSTSFFLSPLSKDRSPSPKLFDANEFVLDLKNYLSTQSGTWGVAITPLTDNRQLTTDNSFGLNLKKQFPAASVMKVLVAANLIHRADKNEFSLTKEVEENSLQDLMRGMINWTDNQAWEILNHFLGFENLQKFGEDLGMKNFNVYENTISPSDVNLLLASIYQNKVASAGYCQLLLSLMQDTETEDRIPTEIPKNIKVYHKAGTWLETGTYSDAGIIEAKNPFILTVLSENVPYQTQAIETIKTVTRKVFLTLTNQ